MFEHETKLGISTIPQSFSPSLTLINMLHQGTLTEGEGLEHR
jgi:hypothetical protein